jgi:hypothetical protein
VVKVYNNEDKDVLIPRVNLEKGAASLYRINVDGKPGYDFKNVPLRKKDSLYIFVEMLLKLRDQKLLRKIKLFS